MKSAQMRLSTDHESQKTLRAQHPASHPWLIPLAIGGGFALAILVICCVCIIRRCRKRRGRPRPEKASIKFELPPVPAVEPCPVNDSTKLNTFDPDLYRDDPEEQIVPYSGSGALCFCVNYDKNTEKMTFVLKRGIGFRSRSSYTVSSSYVKIYLLPDKKRKCQSKVRKTQSPEFMEEFMFPVPIDSLSTRTFEMTVHQFDRFSRHTIIGHVIFPLKDAHELLKIERGKSVTTTGDVWREINEDDGKCLGVDKGGLLFSLQYLPTAGRLTIVILKAKCLRLVEVLKDKDKDRDIDPYVKIAMIVGGKAIKSRKTTIKRKDENPVWNEAFVFADMLSLSMDRVSFVLSVYTNLPKLSGNKRLIGRAIVGPFMYSTGAGLQHWNDMLASPRSAVAQWHSLI